MINDHRAEFVAFKYLAVFAYPVLDKKDRAGHLDLNQNCDDKQDRPQEQQAESADYSVEEPFKEHILIRVLIAYIFIDALRILVFYRRHIQCCTR